MEIIIHRVNSIDELKKIPHEYGVELDLRDYNNQLILQHDPYKNGCSFEEYLNFYNHGTMILNIKSEGIEYDVLNLLKKYEIRKYFFLDCSFPMINSLINLGESNIALRFSEFEGLDTINRMSNKVNWIWIDCFTKIPLTEEIYKNLKKNNYKLCFVSPDLQNQKNKILDYSNFFKRRKFDLDAVCVKYKHKNIWK